MSAGVTAREKRALSDRLPTKYSAPPAGDTRKILAMGETATRELDTQALE